MAPRDSADRMVTTTFFLVAMLSGKTLINEETGILLSKAGAHFGRFASSMQASYASGYALGSPHRILGTQKSMKTIQYGFACLMRTFSKATEARSAVVAGQTGGCADDGTHK